MTTYLRPGAYTERIDAAQANRLLLRSDIPGFVGIAEKGPLDVPVPLESFRQFEACFGGFIGAGFLAYSVRAFFDNGGRRCWVVRVASRSFDGSAGLAAQSAAATVTDLSGAAVWSIQASSEGGWGNRLEIALLEEHRAEATVAAVDLTPRYARVSTTAGFTRGSLVRISQEDSGGGLRDFYRVVCFVDAQRQRLYWVHPEPALALPYDRPLTDFDAQRPARVTTLGYRIDVYDQHRLLAMYSGLSLIPEHPDYGPTRLAKFVFGKEMRVESGALASVPVPIAITPLQSPTGDIPHRLQITTLQRVPLKGGQEGLGALSHRDFIGEEWTSRDSDALRRQKNRGLAALDQVDEITLVAVPDIVIRPDADPDYRPDPPPELNPCLPCPPPPEPRRRFTPPRPSGELPPLFSDEQVFQVQAAMVAHCERRGDRFALLDPPFHVATDAEQGIAAIHAWRSRFDSSYAALYYPWVKVIDPRRPGNVRAIPPSGHALGQYALLDNEVGVHRAPANRPLQWIQDLSLHTTFGQQELLNPLAVNVLRSEGPRGIRIMGARTLGSDPDWTYVNVRRLLIMIRRALEIISQWVVFEPNHAPTRNKFQVAVGSYLGALWSRGALAGATQQQAFFVKCDEENNPPQQGDNGQLLAEIGVAPSYPFEFVILRVGVQENELKFSETEAVTTTV